MKCIHHSIVYEKEVPLVGLFRFQCTDVLPYVFAAEQELASFWKDSHEKHAPWGYYPVHSPKESEYPKCLQLHNQLQEAVLSHIYPKASLAFIQYMPSGIQPNNGNFHLDVHKENAITLEEERCDKDVLRILLNLHTSAPRTLRYLAITKEELLQRGDIDESEDFHTFATPKNVEERLVDIPPITENEVSILTMWGNIVPHVGFTTKEGQMLASYGLYAYKDRTSIDLSKLQKS